MTMISSTALSRVRQKFLADGNIEAGIVSAPILRSWKRCSNVGLVSEETPSSQVLTASELRNAMERDETLLRLSRPEIEGLYANAKATGSIIILTDRDGLILDTIGDAGFSEKAARVSLQPGVSWGETSNGTNAIGTAIMERGPVAVHGSEHYFDKQSILSCAAAPILSPFGDLIGVLDISGHARTLHTHAEGLIRLSVNQIEHRLFERDFDRFRILRFHTDAAMVGTVREGLLAFEGDVLAAANRRGLASLGLDWEAIGRKKFGELFSSKVSPSNEDSVIRSREGQRFHGRIRETGRAHKTSVFFSQTPVQRPIVRSVEPYFDEDTGLALKRAVRLTDGNVPVLIHGETGTGKEIFARAIHGLCARKNKPFVAVNCAALPESLIESELFGYEEGAYTGARKKGSLGLLREAHGGVLFLDEIGDMPISMQARLLRALQEREVRPLGSSKSVPVDFCLLCATHRNLRELSQSGSFRSDLYYRIAQYTVSLKPVRDLSNRRNILDVFWRQLGGRERSVVLDEKVRDSLVSYDWPGNFREFVSALQALLVLAESGEILSVDALPAHLRQVAEEYSENGNSKREPGAQKSLKCLTKDLMQKTLDECSGNVSQAARKLGVNRSTLYRRLKFADN
ncbi:sigma-54-dependent Fis family transcriptional regulator [Pelagicoccus albus]|uniref:Sigma-54-dependent Fis family transcriptional regulator n=2 Tax=Pelagicoccus albus TaxID=415222 RepID=A0A7X1EAE9_9BACT|nr:sigma-54-dependent Fis family transcriptional regulator [Pelagicoccus albus]